jgi:hypothetical protein
MHYATRRIPPDVKTPIQHEHEKWYVDVSHTGSAGMHYVTRIVWGNVSRHVFSRIRTGPT